MFCRLAVPKYFSKTHRKTSVPEPLIIKGAGAKLQAVGQQLYILTNLGIGVFQ